MKLKKHFSLGCAVLNSEVKGQVATCLFLNNNTNATLQNHHIGNEYEGAF